jgi:hypothetical protein
MFVRASEEKQQKLKDMAPKEKSSIITAPDMGLGLRDIAQRSQRRRGR